MTSGVVSHFSLLGKLRANNKSSIEEVRERGGSKGRIAATTAATAPPSLNSTGINQNLKADSLAYKLNNKLGNSKTSGNNNNDNYSGTVEAYAIKNEELSERGASLLVVENGPEVFPVKNSASLNLATTTSRPTTKNKSKSKTKTKAKAITTKKATRKASTKSGSKRKQIKASEWCKRLLVGACKQAGARIVKGSMIRGGVNCASSSTNNKSISTSNNNGANKSSHFISKPMMIGEADKSAQSSNTQSQINHIKSVATETAVAGAAASNIGKTNTTTTSNRHLISEFSWRLVKRCTKARVVQFASRAGGLNSSSETGGKRVENSGSQTRGVSNDFNRTASASAAVATATKNNTKRTANTETKEFSGGSSRQATSGRLGLSFAKSFARRRRKTESDSQSLSDAKGQQVGCEQQAVFKSSEDNKSIGRLSASSSSMAATIPSNAFTTPPLLQSASHLVDGVDQSSITTLPISSTNLNSNSNSNLNLNATTTAQQQQSYIGGSFVIEPSSNQLGACNNTNSSVSTITSETTTNTAGCGSSVITGNGLICCQYCQEHCQSDIDKNDSLHESGCFVSSSLAVGSGNSCGLTNCSDSITTQHSSQSSSSTPNSTNNNSNNNNFHHHDLSSVVIEFKPDQDQDQEHQQQLVVTLANTAAVKPSSTCDLKSSISGHFLSENLFHPHHHHYQLSASSPTTSPASLTTSTMFLETKQEPTNNSKFTSTSNSSTSIFKSNNKNQNGSAVKKKQGSFFSRARDSTINLSSLASVTRSFGYSASVGNLWSSHSQQRKELAELSGDSPQASVRPLDIVAQAAFDSNTFSPSFHNNNSNNNHENPNQHQNGCERALNNVVQATNTNNNITNSTTANNSNNNSINNSNSSSNNSNKLSITAADSEDAKLESHSPSYPNTHHIMSTKEKEWRQKEAEKMEKLRLLVTYLKNGRSADILPINKTTSACANPQNFAVWIDNEVNSLINDLEVKSQLVKSGKDHVRGGKLKWLSPSSRRNSSGAHST